MPGSHGEEAEAEAEYMMGGDEDNMKDEEEEEDENDTTAAQARNGKDIQGIPWDVLSISRENYRKTRLQSYKNFENIPNSGHETGKV